MRTNMGTIDRWFRILLALIIVFLYYNGSITGKLAISGLAVVGIFIVTSFLGFCPLYWPFGISTKKQEPKSS